MGSVFHTSKPFLKISLLLFLSGISVAGFSQMPDLGNLKPDPEKEKMFSPYIMWKHGWTEHFEQWKSENTLLYYKELWYYSQSFYVKRNYLAEGVTLNESIIDITRFESSRKATEESIVILPGFKDVLVLLPANQLIYNPETK